MKRLFSFRSLNFISKPHQIILPPLYSLPVDRRAGSASHFCRKSTNDYEQMDLSDMRKKYKGDEEVMFMFFKQTFEPELVPAVSEIQHK